MPETEFLNMCEYVLQPKITLQVILDRGIQNPTKHLKWFKMERLIIINCSLELFPKDIVRRSTGM